LSEMVIDGELGADDKAGAGEIARRLYEQLELADAPERASRRTTSRE